MFIIALFAALPLVAATLRNITITDQSPTIFYSPPRAGPASETWNITYSGSNNSAWTPGAVGNGDSTHYTTFVGASLSFGFKGTAVYVLGSETNDGDSVMTIGNNTADTGPEGILGYRTGMADKWWPVKLNVTGTGGVNITGIIFTVNIGSDSAILTESSISTLSGSLNAPNPDFNFEGDWWTRQLAGPNDSVYPRIDTSAVNNRGTLPPMSNESFVMIYGTVNYDHGSFRVNSSDPLPGWPAFTVPNGNSPWFSFDKVLWFGAVDKGTVSITNLEDGRWLDIAKVDVISASERSERPANGTDAGGSSDGGGASTGLIAGVVVGGVAVLAIIAVLAWLLWRRRRRQQAGYYQPHKVNTGPGEIDPYRETTEMPPPSGTTSSFPDPQMAYAHAGSGSTGSEWGIAPFPMGQDPSARHSTLSADNLHPGLHPSGPSTRSDTSTGMLVSLQTSAKSPRPHSNTNTNVRQETDAGSVSVIPPSYDPTWAQAHGEPGQDRSSMLSGSALVGQDEPMELPGSTAVVHRAEKR